MKKTLSAIGVGVLLAGGTTFYVSKNSTKTPPPWDMVVPMLIPPGYETNRYWELLASTNGQNWSIVPQSSYSITNNVLTVTNDGKPGMHFFRYWWYR